MSRPLLILILVVVVIIAVLLGLASLDRGVTVTHVEQPVTNAVAN